LAVLRAVARFHDGERLTRGENRAMAATRMIGMAMGDERAGLWRRWIDPRIRHRQVKPVRVRFDPGAGTGHKVNMTGKGAGFHRDTRMACFVVDPRRRVAMNSGVIVAVIGFVFVAVLLYATAMNRRHNRSDEQRTEEATKDLYARIDREEKISDPDNS